MYNSSWHYGNLLLCWRAKAACCNSWLLLHKIMQLGWCLISAREIAEAGKMHTTKNLTSKMTLTSPLIHIKARCCVFITSVKRSTSYHWSDFFSQKVSWRKDPFMVHFPSSPCSVMAPFSLASSSITVNTQWLVKRSIVILSLWKPYLSTGQRGASHFKHLRAWVCHLLWGSKILITHTNTLNLV